MPVRPDMIYSPRRWSTARTVPHGGRMIKQVMGLVVAAMVLAAWTESEVAPLGIYKPAERRHWAFQPRKAVPAAGLH